MKRIVSFILLFCTVITSLTFLSCEIKCQHVWQDATCVTPKYCLKCQIVAENALDHTWEEASCTTPKKCSRCNVTEGNVAMHNYVDFKCSMCEDTEPIFLEVQNIYEKLNELHNLIYSIAISGYNANVFKFSLSCNYDDDEIGIAITEFANITNISESEISNVIKNPVISDLNHLILRWVYQSNGTFQGLSDKIDELGVLLPRISEERKNDIQYNDLNDYFAYIKSFTIVVMNFYSEDYCNLSKLNAFGDVMASYLQLVQTYQDSLSQLYG